MTPARRATIDTTALAMVLAAAVSVSPAAAAQTLDERWTPFVGCWELQMQRPVRSAQPPARAEAQAAVPELRSARVCVEPQGAGVVMRTLVADQPALSQTIVADAAPRPILDGPCRGTERAEWSKDGQRLFSSASLTCPGEPERAVSGLVLFTTPDSWIDVQAVTVASRESVRVRHYRREEPQAGPRRATAATRLTIDDVVEATGKVSPGALEAALIESRARFPLSGGTLIALDEAGVPDSVTDLMVALSYPQAFVVERTSRDDRLTSVDSFGYTGFYGIDDGFPPFLSGLGYGGYYDSAYFYSPFGYSYLRTYPGIFGSYAGGIIAVGGGGGSTEPPSVPGRVINGQGYTRVLTTRDAEAQSAAGGGDSPRAGSGRGTVTRQGFADGGSSSGGTSSASSGGGGGAGTSSGSSGDTGRAAVPR